MKKLWKKILLRKNKIGDNKEIKRVLFMTMTFGLGDGILNTGVIEALAENYQLDTLGNVNQEVINKYNEKINKIYTYKCKANKKIIKSLLVNFKLILELRKNKYDLIIDGHSSSKSFNLLFLRLINATKIYGLRSVNNKYKFNENEITLYDKLFYTTEEIIENLGLKKGFDKIHIPNSCLEKNREYLEKNKIKVIFNTEGNSRAIERKKIIEILDLLNDSGIENIYMISTPQRRAEIEEIINKNNYSNIKLLPKTNFYDAINFIENSEILISPNTSLIHVASLYNKKILGIYTNVKWHIELWRPKVENYELVISTKETEDTDDLGEIDSREILLALKRLLEK